MSGKATARYRCAQPVECQPAAWADTDSPTFTAPRLGCPTCCKPQHFPTGPKHSPSNSLSQHLNPALRNTLNLTSTTPSSHTQGSQVGSWTGKPTSRAGSWPAWASPCPQQALGRVRSEQKTTYFASLRYFRGSVKLWQNCIMNPVFKFTELLPWLFGDDVFLGVIRPFKIMFQHNNRELITRIALKKKKEFFCKIWA